ncbi:helix-hairpin-helix domain-containing protein [Kaistella jeonii]|uniref:Helix-hairpin-helix domain-containing protein n=1 Tax=Kaistella jeonii TaxID=266749 RepID=A0A0C1FS32_9FLAO|nr:helix-hairpin-helix domain-containing protein [Kaistella jeonii]KIA90719.1 hypothetical protein OA86_02290 [Kaistella jeonii]SFB68697.1 Helix-hairpin-helix motif-containing protein [Kaistella jeonii]VEI94665.1 comEA protein [Kaistella jeonii]
MSFHIQFSAAKNYFLGFATSGTILFSSLLYFNSKNQPSSSPTFKTEEYIASEKFPLKEFNPNKLTEEGWVKLGFTERKVATILKYKEVVGGNFTSKAQLKKCYAISPEKFNELEAYILLPETGSSSYKSYSSGGYKSSGNYSNNYKTFKKKDLIIPGKFNPDNFSVNDFVKMGFTENQATSILKYKNYLGGSFLSKEKFKACFMISEENYRKMAPYILLPENTPENYSPSSKFKSTTTEKAKTAYQSFDPNTTDFEGWKKLGFSEKQAQVILNYRDRNLKGSFKNMEEIASCFVISPEKMEEIKPYMILNPENFKTISSKKQEGNYTSESKASSVEAKTDFSKIDLNQITFKQMVEFGFDEKSAAMMLSFRKKLGGFANTQQIIDTYEIDKNLAQKLIAIARLDQSKIVKYTLSDAPEEWLKNHPYFKYSADKIIYIRSTSPNNKKIFNFIKVKPEYEARMKLYLAQD